MVTNLQKYAEIQAMVQKDARDIAEQVYKQNAAQFGVAKVPLHYHNGSDAPIIPPLSVRGFKNLPAISGGILDPATLGGRIPYWIQPETSITQRPEIPVFPLPVISGDIGGESLPFTEAAAGDAPDGTLLIYKEAAAWQLWIRLFGSWHGVDLPLTPTP